MKAATKAGEEWKRLFTIGLYTGLRLGDCCCLAWNSVNLERGVIQLIPTKTRKHAHGQPVTIPIHPSLAAELVMARDEFSDRINRIDRIKNDGAEKRGRSANVPARLRRLDKYLAQGLITQDEYAFQRARILAEL